MQMCTVLQQDVSGKDGEVVALCNFATDDASPDAIFVECGRIAELGLGLGLGFRGAGGRHARQYFGWHDICVRIGYRLSSLDMGPCAWRRRLGAILGRGAGTSRIRVRVRVRVRVRYTTHAVKMHYHDSSDAG